MDNLDACTYARKLAGEALARALGGLLGSAEPISETDLSDRWLAELHRESSLYPEGWYTPPEHGMFVAFAPESEPARVSAKSFRPFRPRGDIYLDRRHGLAALYASPVHRPTGMIGDFGLTLYFGENSEIQRLLKDSLATNLELFEWLKPGITLADIAGHGAELLKKKKLISALASPSDPTGTNIGHSLPASDTGWSPAEAAVLRGADWAAAAALISARRAFLNASDHTRIGLNMAHTLEPRPQIENRPDLPTVFFHTTVVWRDGHKQLLTGFKQLFEMAGMNYMPK